MAEVAVSSVSREHPDSLPVPAADMVSHAAEARPCSKHAAAAEDPAPLWLRRGDQAVVATLVALGLLFLSVHAWRMGIFHGDVVDIERLPETAVRYRLDVNQATWVEWSQLDGIGETLARRIIADREANGPFQALEDVQRVKGLGPKTFEKIRPWLTLRRDAP
jgi:competence protein ComEA